MFNAAIGRSISIMGHMSSHTKRGWVMGLAAGACLGLPAWSDNPQSQTGSSVVVVSPGSPSTKTGWLERSERFGGIKAETRPKLDTTMQFSFASEVREINARGGQRVNKGEVLMRARDAEIVAALDQQRLVANSDLEIKAAEIGLEFAEFRFDQLRAGGNYTPAEFEELKSGARNAKVQLDQAKVNLERQKLALKQLEGQAERYYLTAPFDGIVEEVMVEVGQGVNEQQKVMRVVNIDNLILDAMADTEETLQLSLKGGSRAWVLLDLPGQAPIVEGKVDYVSPVADSVSQTRRVRVDIPNPQGWPAGTQARVRFTAPASEVATTTPPSPGSAASRPEATPTTSGVTR